MGTVETYVKLANRPNTQRSYASAVQHFEVEGRGVLPATPEAIAGYLAHYAESLSINTLHSRLSGLSKWHREHRVSQMVRLLLALALVFQCLAAQAAGFDHAVWDNLLKRHVLTLHGGQTTQPRLRGHDRRLRSAQDVFVQPLCRDADQL